MKLWMFPDRCDLYDQAMDRWGIDSQYLMLIEELAEFLQATVKLSREMSEENVDNFAEEMNDLRIMMEQVERIMVRSGVTIDRKGESMGFSRAVRSFMVEKMNRLQGLLRIDDLADMKENEKEART